MIVVHRTLPPALPSSVVDRVQHDVEQALRSVDTVEPGQFLVNPSPWYAAKEGRAKRAVMNSARFISRAFQQDLERRGWKCEYKRRDQKIDAFKTFTAVYESFTVTESRVPALLHLHFDGATSLESIDFSPRSGDSPHLPSIVRSLYSMYVERSIHTAPEQDSDVAAFFSSQGVGERSVRFGLEFETGNIASAFRSLMKLNILYELDEIDAGIFITTDRESATSIWPASNRNGSFEELENRRYQRNVLFPIWETLFRPDGFATSAPYLASDGTLYQPEETGETFSLGDQEVPVFRSDSGARVYKGLDTVP